MQNNDPADSALVVLRNGPSGIPHEYRRPSGYGGSDPERLSVTYCAQREHFERTGEKERVDGSLVPVFQWIYSTKIAE